MIRDEFIKQQKEKKLSAKALEKIRSMGERAYYVTEINKLSNLKKVLKFSAILMLVLSAIVTLVLLIPLIMYKKLVADMIAPSIILGVFWLVIILWFALFLPLINRKIRLYTKEYERVKLSDLNKQMSIYNKINK